MTAMRRLLLAAVFVTGAGCGEPVDSVSEPALEGSAVEASGSGAVHRVSTVELRAALQGDFEGAYGRYVDANTGVAPLRYFLLEDSDAPRIRRRAFLASVYDARAWAPVFVDSSGLTEHAHAVLDTLARAEEHALDVDQYLRSELIEAVALLEELTPLAAALPAIVPTADELAALEALAAEPAILADEDPLQALFERALEGDSPALADLAPSHRDRLTVEQALRGQRAITEALIADAFLAWAFDQRHFNLAMIDDDLDADERDRLIAERMRTTFNEMAAAPDRSAADSVMQGLQPHHPQYPALMHERARYAAIVAAGGWERVEPMSLRRGHNHARVAQLKTRLTIEGYYDGPIDEQFDDALRDAVSLYQETHQMDVTGESSRDFWTSLNITAADRLAQIELTMQRWRESRAGDDPYYVFVNIPDFHAEIWRNGVREMRFRVVVGNTQRVCDPATHTLRYANATPIQSARMTYVVLNPSWNVPPRILEEELLPELMEDETYFAEHGIERVVEGGVARVRQLPGPSNPLGRVKFIFPNPHDTYMHDTSRPQYFDYSVRAFSHGCMRVQDPVSLLEYVLTNDGQWDEARIMRIFESNIETSMRLNTAIPVHVEYYVVRVDDNGRANFLSDIYRYDRDRLNPPSPADLRCTPEGELPLDLVLGEDGRPAYRDPATGTVMAVDSVEARRLLGEEIPEDGATGVDPAAGDFGP